MSKIILYGYNQEHAGGVQNLHINLSKQLVKFGEEVIVFTQEKSFIYKNLVSNEDKIHIINTSEVPARSWHNYISNDDLLIITNFTTNLRPLLKANPRVLFWSVLPGVFKKANSLFTLSMRKQTIKLIEFLIDRNGLVFMDKANLDSLYSDFRIRVKNPSYLPIPVEISTELNTNVMLKNENEVTITYIGRGEAIWKVKPFMKLLNDIESMNKNLNISIVVITNYTKNFQEAISQKQIQNCHIKFKTNLFGKELDEFLKKNSDIHFAMGTSALESAKLSIPTVVIDASHEDFPEDYRYIWLYESKDFNLGRFIDKYPYFNIGHAIEEIIDALISDSKEISKLSYEYALRNHSIGNILPLVLKYSYASSCDLESFCRLTYRQSYFFQKARAIKLGI